jgi:ABC-2 type transport system ATP-binding protein
MRSIRPSHRPPPGAHAAIQGVSLPDPIDHVASPDTSHPAIETIGLVRRYRDNVALGGVDMDVWPGEVVALLGPNGAGKSTLIRILATTLLPSEGKALIAGCDVTQAPQKARRAIGLVLSEERSFFWRLSGAANLEFFGALHGLGRAMARQRAAEALAVVDLADVASRRVDRYSTGMRSRLAIARALLGRPRVLLLDEPTSSLDPVVAREVRTMVAALAADHDVAVLYATHDLHEAAAIASRTMILVRGRVAGWAPAGTDAAELEAALVRAVGET